MKRKLILGTLLILFSMLWGIKWIYFDAITFKLSEVSLIVGAILTFIILLFSFLNRKNKPKVSQILLLFGLEAALLLAYSYYQPVCEPCLSCEDCSPCLSKEQKMIFWIGLFLFAGWMLWKMTERKPAANSGLAK